MKKLLATTAVALVALSGAASAQSVLERVLGAVEQVNLDTANVSQLNGIFANIAENVAVLNDDGTEILNAIDGSITNLITGLTEATAEAGEGDAVVFDLPQIDIGALSTTVLGAVNTGDITLGVNQDVAEAISGTTSAVSASISQLGGSAETGLLVLNIASNATDVIATVTNTFEGVNGSIGDVATTALGAVNTGTITSGINAAVSGVQAGIIGPAAN